MDTNIGEIPALPAQVEAVYNDGTTGAVNVVWEEITADMVAKAGTFAVNGTVEGTRLKAKATYRVKFVDQGKTLLNIQPPAVITELANGIAKTAAALGLLATIELVTDTGSLNANVTWDVNRASYDSSAKTAQTFTVTGTVTLPEGVSNPNNVALATDINVTANAFTTSR
ncbi:hypothetical protein BACCIP111899_00836 [Bacillus rhizoplanae]|uniref:Bacterial Ig-like domain-containing protein n=1 Tax=Bacillus rhizoplanae TaxID=2880966 RepID=A0ABM8Y7D6_9BACI|nr:Ig-like domain-containing protein [Bacillus rhizoplanae]CAG9611664.1 hypothetical protein BACCIP111899_00836 [Bacillus rhizoplanae]